MFPGKRQNALENFLEKHFDLGIALPRPVGAHEDAKELAASSMIPYTYPYDDETIITKDDGLMQVIKLDGIFFDSLSKDQIKNFERVRNTLWRSIAGSGLTVYVHLIRKKVDRYPEGEGGTFFSRYFNRRWRERFAENPFYVNEIYISFVLKSIRRGAIGIVDKISSFLNAGQNSQDDPFERQAVELNSVVGKALQAFSEYGARRLTIQRLPKFESTRVGRQQAQDALERFQMSHSEFVDTYGDQPDYDSEDMLAYLGAEFSEIEGFLYYLVNLADAKIPVSSLPVDKRLSGSYIKSVMWGKVLEVESLTRRRVATVISMAEWPERTPSKMLDEFLKCKAEFIITQSFSFVDRIAADTELKRQLRTMKVNDAESNEENIKDIKDARRQLLAGRAVDGWHHLTILIHVAASLENTLESKQNAEASLNEAVSRVDKAFLNIGVKPVREFLGTETFFWSQLPGQHPKFIGRRGRISSANFAGFASMHNYATGRIAGNLWGAAIMPFQTESNSAYMFNFHRELEGMVAGHAAFSADTGAGKTTLLCALVAMADKARPRVFWFDNRQGAIVFMEAMGGQHYTLSPLGNMGWNPLQLPDTPENRLFLRDWMGMMRTYNGDEISTDDMDRINKAINENYQFTNTAKRRLRHIAWCFGDGEMGKAMHIWYGDGEMAGIFDNEKDNIDFSACRHYCFEMMQLIVEGKARKELPIMLNYIFHRITDSMNGDPFIIVCEEGQNLVTHAIWQQKIDNLIMQIRRKNGILIFVTPDPKYIYTPVESIKKQTATKLFLPNNEATREDYIVNLGLTEEEFSFIKGTSPKERKFLIRRGAESIRAIFDLSDIPEVIPILSSNDKVIALMRKIRHELNTNNPDIWVPELMKQAMEENTHNLRQVVVPLFPVEKKAA